jgi:uncharacterized repeat protein (TIGR01451 family)
MNMKFLNTFKFYAKRLKLNKIAAIAALGLLIAVPTAIALAEYYPARSPFDYNKPCNPNDDDIYDRCGSLTGPVFNSFINTPSYGDERAFLDARRSDQTAAGSYENVLDDVTDGSKEIVVRMYVHNNANQDTNASGLGIAKNAKVRVDLPEATANSLRARGYISADNAALVEDTVDFVDNKKFSVDYIPGSAKLYDNDNFKDGVKLSDSIVTTGAAIGSDSLNGELKGCFEYEAVVQIRLKVTPVEIPVETPKADFNKEVRASSNNPWGETTTVKPGDNVEWLIGFENIGDADLTNVNINDKLPPYVSVVPGSVKWIYTANNGDAVNATQDDEQLFTTGGMNFDTWKPSGGFYLRFDTTANGDFEGCEVSIRNVARLNTSQTSQIEDTADVTIKKTDCTPPVASYSCDALSTFQYSRTVYGITINGSANNTNITGYKFVATGPAGDDSITDSFVSNGFNANYAVFNASAPGKYRITGQVITEAGTTQVSEICSANITVEEEPEEPTYSCDLLEAKKISDRKYKLTATASAAGGATIKHYTYSFGDDSADLISTNNMVEHTYPADGKFTTKVTVSFNVDGQVATHTGKACEVVIKTATPKTPEELPNTGPSEVVGLFSAVTIAGGMAHSAYSRRRG